MKYRDEVAPVTAEDIDRMKAAIASQHDRQAAVGDVPADVEIDDTETADRGVTR